MNLIQFLAMKLHQGPVFINGIVNSTEVLVHSKTNFVKVVQNQYGMVNSTELEWSQNKFREGRLKSVFIPQTIDAVRQLILQDRHVTYREIETILGNSGTSINSILHEYLTVKKICAPWIPHNLSIAQKNQSNRVIDNWFKRLQTGINLNGIYFEKQ